jgi:hypothetical protein
MMKHRTTISIPDITAAIRVKNIGMFMGMSTGMSIEMGMGTITITTAISMHLTTNADY